MNVYKALNILGLKSNFTEEELKRAYRELANKYHPDINQNPNAETNMKEINQAKDVLEKYIKFKSRIKQDQENNQNNYNANDSQQSHYNNAAGDEQTKTVDLKDYHNKKVTELQKIIYFDFKDKNVSETIEKIFKELQKIMMDFYTWIRKPLNNKQFIDKEYERCLEEIKKQFKRLEQEFYKENEINPNYVQETINYNCTLNEFYNQLMEINKKYGKEAMLNEKLEQEISKYTNYAGYEIIKTLIKNCKIKTLKKFKDNGLQYNQKDVDKMHEDILGHFNKYYSLKQRLTELESKIAEINDPEITKQFTKLKNRFKLTVRFADIEDGIAKLEKLIIGYEKKQDNKQNNPDSQSSVNEIYQSLTARYCEALKKYNIVTDYKKINVLNELYGEILKVFKKGLEDSKHLEYFSLFNEITFEGDSTQILLIKTILNSLNSNDDEEYEEKYKNINYEKINKEIYNKEIKKDTMYQRKRR